MSFKDIEEVKKLDPHVDPIDVSRLMFVGLTEGIAAEIKKHPIPKGPKGRPPDPITLVAGTLFLIATVPVGGISEGIVRTYRKVRERRVP